MLVPDKLSHFVVSKQQLCDGSLYRPAVRTLK